MLVCISFIFDNQNRIINYRNKFRITGIAGSSLGR